MNWEDHVINAGNKQKKNDDEISQRYSKLDSSINVIDPIIRDYCDKFSNSGVHVRLEYPKKQGLDDSEYIITARFHTDKIDGRIGVEIEPHKFPCIVVTYASHGREKISRYHGAVPEKDVEKWIKYATRQASIFDQIRKKLLL